MEPSEKDRKLAIQILEWLNFDSELCSDWIEGIAELIANHKAGSCE